MECLLPACFCHWRIPKPAMCPAHLVFDDLMQAVDFRLLSFGKARSSACACATFPKRFDAIVRKAWSPGLKSKTSHSITEILKDLSLEELSLTVTSSAWRARCSAARVVVVVARRRAVPAWRSPPECTAATCESSAPTASSGTSEVESDR